MSDKQWTTFIESGVASGWNDLIGFRPPTDVQRRLADEPLEAQVQAIEHATGDINLDYYPIVIRRFPRNPDQNWWPKERHNATSLLELFRRFMVGGRQDELWDTGLSEFFPFNDEEKQRWFRGEALGSVLHIDIKPGGVNAEDGSVVCSHVSSTEFRVSTIWVAEDSFHPVTGNREFGFWRSGKTSAQGVDRIDWETGRHYQLVVDEWTFYTRAADRVTPTVKNKFLAEDIFEGAKQLWSGMQSRFAAFINANGGEARVGPHIAELHDWSAIEAFHFAPTTPWVEPTA